MADVHTGLRNVTKALVDTFWFFLALMMNSCGSGTTDIYEIQANIAAHVALILKVNFDDAIYKLIAQGPTNNIDAYYYYIQGLALTNSGKQELAKQAFSAALVADPNFTLAKESLNNMTQGGLRKEVPD